MYVCIESILFPLFTFRTFRRGKEIKGGHMTQSIGRVVGGKDG